VAGPTILKGEAEDQGLGNAGSGGQLPPPPKIWSWSLKLHMALTSNRCQSNGNDHLLTINTVSLGEVKVNVSCYIIKLDFITLTPPPVEKCP